MVKALLDTNILIDHLNASPQADVEIDRYEDCAISIISWIEVMAGAEAELAEPTRAYLKGYKIIGLDDAIAERAVSIRQSRRLKLPDAVIWATAQTTSRLLVTRNTKDFPTDDPGVRAPYVL